MDGMNKNATDGASRGRGGKRAGSGRKRGSSDYGESTRPLRIPESLIQQVENLLRARKKCHQEQRNLAQQLIFPASEPLKQTIPLFAGRVAAGFPSPADDYVEKRLDLNELLVKRPAATFFVRAEGESMLGAGIHPGDILVVDRSLEPVSGAVVICAVNGELTVKSLRYRDGQPLLVAENPDYADILLNEETDMVIWGVVTNVIHALG